MQNTKSNVYNMVFVPKGTVGRPSWVVFVYIDWNIWFHFSLQSRSWLRRSFGIMLIIFFHTLRILKSYLGQVSCNHCSATPGGFLDFFPDPARHRAGPDGPFDHPLPCPHQHLQQCHNQLAKGYIAIFIVIVIVFCLSSLSSSSSWTHQHLQ